MNLLQFMNAVDCRVCGGNEYQWSCYPDAQYMDISDIDGKEIGSCVFNRKTQEVYEIDVHAYEDRVSYRWIEANYLYAHNLEAESRNIDYNIAYDNVKYINSSEDEILDLIHKIIHKVYVHRQPSVAQEFDETSKPNWEELAGIANSILKDVDDNLTEYEVKLTVIQLISVKGNSMEEVSKEAAEFVLSMKPSKIQPENLVWQDCYISKEEVARNLIVE